MISRFQGIDGAPRLLLALKSQCIVKDDVDIAAELADRITLTEHTAGTILITQDAPDNNMHFILSGRVLIRINGRGLAFRGSGTHIGEMALINPSARRSATVIAIEPTITAVIEEREFCTIADRHPKMWRYIAMELVERLSQRSQYIRQPNLIPKLFLGSSSESTWVMNEVIAHLDQSQVIPVPWTNIDIFKPSHSAIEDIESELDNLDFAVLIFGPDDIVISRQVISQGPRDNILLECGMFLGAIGRDRTYFIKPRDIDVKVPSDLFGLMPLEYDHDVKSRRIDVTQASEQIMRCVQRYGAK